MKKKSKSNSLGLANDAVRKAHEAELAELFRQRAQSNASGMHGNKAEKRSRTRSAAKSKAVKDFD